MSLNFSPSSLWSKFFKRFLKKNASNFCSLNFCLGWRYGDRLNTGCFAIVKGYLQTRRMRISQTRNTMLLFISGNRLFILFYMSHRILLTQIVWKTFEWFINTQIGNNDNIGIKGFYHMKAKKIPQQMLPQWALNLGPQPFRSGALFSLSYWGMCYLGYPYLLFLNHFNLGLRSFR